MLDLPFYPRSESDVQLRMIHGAETVSLKVKNAARRKRTEWIGQPLPQTNVIGNMLVSVRHGAGDSVRFNAKTTNGPSLGWMYWRYEVEDAVGNWQQSSWSSHGWELDRSKFERGPLKLTVFPEEYLTAGYVSEPAPGEFFKLGVHPRAAALGLKDAFILGCGEFVVRSVADVVHVEPAGIGSEGVRISATRPNAVVMFRSTPNVERIDARVHERWERGESRRIFRSVPQRGEERSMSNRNVVRNFPIVWERTTNQTEVEVIVRHRPVVFYVDFEKEKAGPKTRL